MTENSLFTNRNVLIFLVPFTICALGALWVHHDLHATNQCGMTFMWGLINLVPIHLPVSHGKQYGLYRYHEGMVNPNTLSIGVNDIPVLFIPGSGGSAKQVRAIASLTMNKTRMAGYPFRFHFYALDFGSELSFLSGHTIIRQKDFAVTAVRHLLEEYSHYSKFDKIVLVGHSFGGLVAYSLLNEPLIDAKRISMIFTMAAPIRKSPIYMDMELQHVYSRLTDNENVSKLETVGLVSLSGGWKDFQVADSFAANQKFVHLPVWSIPLVSTSTDHLCILWCNQVMRYTSRILMDFGWQLLTPGGTTLTGKDILHNYLRKEKTVSLDTVIEEDTIDGSNRVFSDTRSKFPIFFDVKDEGYFVMSFSLTFDKKSCTPECSISMLMEWPDGRRMESVRDEEGQLTMTAWPYGPTGINKLWIYTENSAKLPKEYQVQVKTDHWKSFYFMLTTRYGTIIFWSILLVAFGAGMDHYIPYRMFIEGRLAVSLIFGSVAACFTCMAYWLSAWLPPGAVTSLMIGASVSVLVPTIHIPANFLADSLRFISQRVHSSLWLAIHGALMTSVTMCIILNPALSLALFHVKSLLREAKGSMFLLSVLSASVMFGVAIAGGVREQMFVILRMVDFNDWIATIAHAIIASDFACLYLFPIYSYLLLSNCYWIYPDARFTVFLPVRPYIGGLCLMYCVYVACSPTEHVLDMAVTLASYVTVFSYFVPAVYEE